MFQAFGEAQSSAGCATLTRDVGYMLMFAWLRGWSAGVGSNVGR